MMGCTYVPVDTSRGYLCLRRQIFNYLTLSFRPAPPRYFYLFASDHMAKKYSSMVSSCDKTQTVVANKKYKNIRVPLVLRNSVVAHCLWFLKCQQGGRSIGKNSRYGYCTDFTVNTVATLSHFGYE
jgi:hypothetical protein